jgi:putative ABC transport system permease protein
VANSVLQGSLLIAEDDFLKLFPSENGYKEFFIDAPTERTKEIAAFLEKSLADEGFSTIPAAQRLAEFNAVQNTYLSTFQALGGLGMLLGSFGLGLVVLRNVLERRGELALLQALGFSRGSIRWLVLSEHVWLLAAGLLAGVLPALLAILPASKATTLPVPWLQLALTAAGIFACGTFASLLAVYVSLRAPLLDSLRNE